MKPVVCRRSRPAADCLVVTFAVSFLDLFAGMAHDSLLLASPETETEREALARRVGELVNAPGQDNADTLNAKVELAAFMSVHGQHETARDLHSQVAKTLEITLGIDSPETLAAKKALAGDLCDLGDNAGGVLFLRRSPKAESGSWARNMPTR
ncbi:MAG: hypothetical protein LBT40_02825 [Deltaproteobacteria bacterium]|jgi:hypothetical protein|nr:hypothetical protein [Deltaproteobacteria bacterium]